MSYLNRLSPEAHESYPILWIFYRCTFYKQFLGFVKAHVQPLGLYIFAMFSTFRDEMQYIFLEKNLIFMVFLAVKDYVTDDI